MARTSLPPGFRFHPTAVELVMYYLKRKVMGKKLLFEAISELNIYKFSPWDLPDKSCLKSKDLEWYYFCPRERKYASGARMNRATETGYWKTTGKDRPVIYSNNIVGMVKTLVFHQGNAPRGQRTDWVIHEYRIEDKNLAETGVALDAYVLCKVFHKNGLGPKNGAQYGAPFKEEDWNDDEEEVPVDSSLPDGPSPVVLALPEYEKSAAAAMSMVDLGNAPGSSLNENDILGNLGDLDHERGNGAIPHSDESDLFNGLEDLSNWDGVNASGHNFLDTRDVGCPVNNMLPQDMAFLELADLDAPLNFSAEFRGTEQMQTGGLSRPCNSSGHEQMLNGSLCTEDNSNSDLRQLWYDGNFPGYNPCLPDLSQISVLPYSSYTQWNSTNVFQTGDVYDSTSAAHNLDFASYGQQEELRNAAGKMERGG